MRDDVSVADLLAPVLNQDGSLNRLKLGRIEQDHRCGRLLRPEEDAARYWFAENGRGGTLHNTAAEYTASLREIVRRDGGTIITEDHRYRGGRRTVTRTIRRFPGACPGVSQCRGVRRARGASRRPRAQATRSSARSGDSPDDGPGEPAGPRLATSRAIRLSVDQRRWAA